MVPVSTRAGEPGRASDPNRRDTVETTDPPSASRWNMLWAMWPATSRGISAYPKRAKLRHTPSLPPVAVSREARASSPTGAVTATGIANYAVIFTVAIPVADRIQPNTSFHPESMVTFWIRTMPMIAIARADSSSFGLRMNHSSLVGLRTVSVIASFGQVLTQLAHSVQLALESNCRGKENIGQPGEVAVPLKHAALDVQVAQISGSARNATIPVRA